MRLPAQFEGWVACALLLITHGALAEYRFDVWTAADSGLPQNSVRAVLQSRDGYLWVGTLDGLARFDGVRFTVFTKANSPGLPGNRTTVLYEDGDGDLWVGLEDGGLARYRQGSFTSFGAPHGLPGKPIRSISRDEQGNLWVLTGYQLLRWEEGQFRPRLPQSAIGPASRLTGGNRPGVIWATNENGLQIFSRGKLTTLNLSNGLPSLRINQVDEDQHGSWWLATEDAGLVKLRDGKVVRVYTERDGLPRNRVSPGPGPFSSPLAREDRKGNLWVNGVGPWLGRLKDGLFTAYPSSDSLWPHSRPPVPGLPASHINALIEDEEGNLWIGTEGIGLIRAREQIVNVLSTQHGLQTGNIYPICEDHTGAVWLGTWDQGLTCLKAGAVTNFTLPEPHRFATALCEDRAGRLWVGTFGGTVIFENGAISKAEVPAGLSNQSVSAICQDRSGTLWFGVERGLFGYQNGELSFYSERDGLAAGSISVIIEGRADRLWIGSLGGLTQLAHGRFRTWTERDGLPSNHVRALYEDGEGILWIGTYDGGLGRLKEGRFTRYTTKEGMFDNGVFQILEDGRGNFWMSSNRGIHRVSKRELNELADGRRRTITAISYGKSDGMLNVECNGGRWPGGVKTGDGKLWFPTQDGVAIINPEAMPTNPQPPPAVIEAFVLDREPQSLQRPVRVPPGKSNIEIQFTGLSLVNSERLQFKYRLTGWDDDWVEASTRRTAYYSHVAPGRYTFTVLAANSDGVWNESGASLALIVLSAWYETWWFRALVVAAFASVAFAFYRARIVRLQREQAAQHEFSRGLIQSQEQERKRIAAELHDSLGQNLLVIKNRAAMAKNPGASASQELDEIARLAGQSIEEVREISQNLRPYQLDRLGLTRALHGLVKKVSSSSELKCAADITPVDRVFSSEAETNLFRIVQEALNNVLKHSGATEARVVVERNEKQVRLLIEDNGRGFDWRAKQSEAAHGMGLSGIAERVWILHGHLAIDSAPGQGTRLKIEVPIPGEKN